MVKSKILIVASADSPLLRERVRMTTDSAHEVVWYTESVRKPDADCRVVHARKITGWGLIDKSLSVFLFFYTYLKEKPDLLHIHWALFTPLLFKSSWPRLLVSVMGSDVNLPGRFGLRRFFARMALDKAQLVTSKSEGMDQAILALGDYRAKIRRLNWGLDESWFSLIRQKSEFRRKLGIDQEAVVYFSPRALEALYRIPDIVRAFAEVRRKNSARQLKLFLAGASANRVVVAEIERLIADESLEQDVILLDHLGREEMQSYFAASDVVVSYASSDGMPQSLYEAMATGCFPIFTDLPCYSELLHDGKNALLCDTRQPNELSNQISAYLEFRDTGNELEILQSNAELIRRHASKETQQEALWSIYEHLLTATYPAGRGSKH